MSLAGSTGEVLRQAAALVYVDELAEGAIELADSHRLLDVLRLRAGETVVVADGRGAYRVCALVSTPVDRGRRRAAAIVEPLGEVERVPDREPVTVGFALAKGDRGDWTVEKLTELGVDRIVPLLTERTVVRLTPADAERRGERLRRVAREAGAQSRRPLLPVVENPCAFDAFVAGLGGSARLAEPGGERDPGDCDTILVGPEGGWAPSELARPFARLDLGDGVLRVETAALAAGALLAARRSGLVESRPRRSAPTWKAGGLPCGPELSARAKRESDGRER